MKKLDQIATSFEEGSTNVIFCSTEDILKINAELSQLPMDSGAQYNLGHFDNSEAIELGFISVFHKGRTLHISDNLTRFMNILQNSSNEKS